MSIDLVAIVPTFVEGYDGASELQMKFGVTPQELQVRVQFEKEAQVYIPVADEAVVRGQGFNPREAPLGES